MRTVLVALDGSPVSAAVLDEAARLGEARLVLFRAVTLPTELPPELLVQAPDRVAETLVARARRELEELARRLPDNVLRAVRVEVATPWRAICQAARDEGAELIVLGGHGYHLIDRVLGTTAARVVNHADRSVLVVRPNDARRTS